VQHEAEQESLLTHEAMAALAAAGLDPAASSLHQSRWAGRTRARPGGKSSGRWSWTPWCSAARGPGSSR